MDKPDTRFTAPPPYFSPESLATSPIASETMVVAGYPSLIIFPILIAVCLRTVSAVPYNGFPSEFLKWIIAPFCPGCKVAIPPEVEE